MNFGRKKSSECEVGRRQEGIQRTTPVLLLDISTHFMNVSNETVICYVIICYDVKTEAWQSKKFLSFYGDVWRKSNFDDALVSLAEKKIELRSYDHSSLSSLLISFMQRLQRKRLYMWLWGCRNVWMDGPVPECTSIQLGETSERWSAAR